MPGVHFEHYTKDVLTIRMQALPATCWVCGADATGDDCGVPVYDGYVLPNDWGGEWGGVAACRKCFEKQSKIAEPTSPKQL